MKNGFYTNKVLVASAMILASTVAISGVSVNITATNKDAGKNVCFHPESLHSKHQKVFKHTSFSSNQATTTLEDIAPNAPIVIYKCAGILKHDFASKLRYKAPSNDGETGFIHIEVGKKFHMKHISNSSNIQIDNT